MKALRSLVFVAAVAGWVYSWYQLRGVRNLYLSGDLGQQPFWLILLLGITSTALIGTAMTAVTRFKVWSYLSVVSGLGLFLSIVLSESAVATSVGLPISFGRALDLALRTRSLFAVVVFVAGIPTLLVLAGISGLIEKSRGLSKLEPADA